MYLDSSNGKRACKYNRRLFRSFVFGRSGVHETSLGSDFVHFRNARDNFGHATFHLPCRDEGGRIVVLYCVAFACVFF